MLPIETISAHYGASVAIIIQACRVHLQTATLKELDELIEKTEINWQQVALFSKMHRIRPVVFRVLLNSVAPAALKEKLKRELQVNTLLNFSIASETERIIERLAKDHIQAIPYKGVAYSKQFYGDISMRESSDIDLVIDAADLPKTFSIFEQEGYKPYNPIRYQSLGFERYCEEEKDLCFDKTISTETGITQSFHVELHYKITHPRFGAPATINKFDLSTTIASELNQGAARFLSAKEHYRAIMLHHLLHDGLEYLKIFVDLATGFRKLNTDATSNIAPPVEDSANYNRSLENVYHTNILFLVMDQLFGVGQTAVINKTHSEEKAAAYFLNFNLHGTVGRYQRHRVFSLLNHYRRTIANRAALIRDKKQRRVFQRRFWIELFLPQQADQEAVPLPRFLAPLYFIIRPIRILLRKKTDA